jgi:hypothetical protein
VSEKKFTAIEMRNEMMDLAKAVHNIEVESVRDTERKTLEEKFLKAIDPSMSIGLFLDTMSKKLSKIAAMYDDKARDRNQLVAPMMDEIDDIRSLLNQVEGALKKSKGSPEDTNKEM